MKTFIKFGLIGLTLISGCTSAGTNSFVVPPCNVDAVVEAASNLAQSKEVLNPRNIKLMNIRQITYHPNEVRTCLANVKDKKGRTRDFFYQVVMTSGIKWVVSDIEL